ncbi:Peptidoglycan-N-acetylglucosamine deacetylase [Paraconexibacter sp. AEG42_29]|uniref:Peptidoglycan-N-acetylglucosamine deacetylase n=1 Tax=Paraconexibacter sp. AEG42_29 TaxID=2997339 RepID=A0AAU7ANW7_9ACTN
MRARAGAVVAGVLVAGLAAGGVATSGGAAQTPRVTGCKSKPGSAVVKNGPRTRKLVALTFDDGPSAGTAQLLASLKTANVKATFFPQADKIPARVAVVKRAFAAGHEFQNHSFTHADLGNGGPEATTELTKASDAIRKATGYTPCAFRPPFDSVGSDLVKRARAEGMSTVAWDVSPADYDEPPAADIVAGVLKATRPGSIIVMHDGEAGGSSTRPNTRKAVPTIISTLKSRGYTFVTVSKLLGYRQTTG